MAAVDPWKQVETVFIPRPEGSNQNYLTVKVNSREYIVPVGEEVEVPWPVAEAVHNMLDELEGVKEERPASGGGGNGVLIVNVQEISTFEQAAEPTYVADKTFAEIEAAIQAGQYAVAFFGTIYAPLNLYAPGVAVMFTFYFPGMEGQQIGVEIMADGTVEVLRPR